MLVFSRRIGEVFHVGEDVVIHILDVRGEKVRLGVDAPSHIPVHRGEVWERIQAEKAREATP